MCGSLMVFRRVVFIFDGIQFDVSFYWEYELDLIKLICAKKLMWILMLCGMAAPAFAAVGAWTDISGISGTVNALGEDAGGGLYAAIEGVVYRQSNGGNNWIEVSVAWPAPRLNACRR